MSNQDHVTPIYRKLTKIKIPDDATQYEAILAYLAATFAVAGMDLAVPTHDNLFQKIILEMAEVSQETRVEEEDNQMSFSNQELAEAFDAYIDPQSHEFDPIFTKKMLKKQPNWFDEGELKKLVEVGLVTIDECRIMLKDHERN